MLSGKSSSCLRRQASSVLGHWIMNTSMYFILRTSRWLFKSAPGRFSPAKNMPE
jgi:hypothetical protein